MPHAMDSAMEPGKWVCRLTLDFGGVSHSYGTGFLTNMPYTNRYCIMTAAHNILKPDRTWVKSIGVKFPSQLSFIAGPDEIFISSHYSKYPTIDPNDESSIRDFGLIAIDKSKLSQGRNLDGGCAFSVLPEDKDLYSKECSVYGYKEGSEELTYTTSNFEIITNKTLSYDNGTQPGVSGGPAFITDDQGIAVAVGIHNYARRATRLTYVIILEMLSWIKDYEIVRTFEYITIPPKRSVKNLGEILLPSRDLGPKYLHATAGTTPKILLRPSGSNINSHFNFVVVSAAKGGHDFSRHQFAISPTYRYNCDKRCNGKDHKSYFLTVNLDLDGKLTRASLEEGSGPSKDSSFRVHKQGRVGFKLSACTETVKPWLAVTQKERKECGCGCISQDDIVQYHPSKPAAFRIAAVPLPANFRLCACITA